MMFGFSGASGSGKTELVNALKPKLEERGYRVGVVGEVVRKVFEEWKRLYGFKTLGEIRKSHMITNFQAVVLLMQLYEEDKLNEHNDVVLVDRTIYDNLFFTIFWHSRDYHALDAYAKLFEKVENRRYKIIFICDPVEGSVDDGFRSVDLNYRRFQDFVISKLIPDAIPKVRLPAVSVEERCEICLGCIERAMEALQ